ncbi:MAG: hypothetical protein ABFD79_03185 [Phycisphaerales bacterium]
MPQDRTSGARANEYGHMMARNIAEKIGAAPITDNSNEFAYEGRLITIRCAKKGNNQIGCTYAMLERIDVVFAAFEEENGIYNIYEMSPALYLSLSRDSKDEGRIGLVTLSDCKKAGRISEAVSL